MSLYKHVFAAPFLQDNGPVLLGQVWISESNPVWFCWVSNKPTVVKEQNTVLMLYVASVSNFVADLLSWAYGLHTTRDCLSVKPVVEKWGLVRHQCYLQICIMYINYHWLWEKNITLNNLILGRSLIKRYFRKKIQFKTSNMATHVMEKNQIFVCFWFIWEFGLLKQTIIRDWFKTASLVKGCSELSR